MAIDTKGFAMRGSYYTSGIGILMNLFGSWGILADAPIKAILAKAAGLPCSIVL